MRSKTVELTMINNAVWYVAADELQVGGIAQDPVSLIGNYIKGSRGPMIKVNSVANGTGTEEYVNPMQIVSMKVTYS